MTKQILLSLLNCSWQWMLLGGLTWFITSHLFHKKHRSNTTVHLLWLLSLLSLPILFGLNQFVPALSIGSTVPELAQAAPVNISGLAAPVTDLPEVSSAGSDTQTGNQLLTGGTSFFNWAKTDLLLCAWAIGTLAMFIRFMFGLSRIRQLRRSAVVADAPYQAICRRLARQLNINRPVTVCFSDRVASPISFGWLSPYILIPRKLNLEQFELVAAHELAHVQRLDWLTNLFSHLVGVIFFFHPIYHFLNRELVQVQERICDDWVIQLTGTRKNYAQCLLDLVRHRDRTIPLALSLNQPSQLESRIDAILKNNRRLDVQLKPRLQLMIATLLLTCLPLLAMAQLVPLKTIQVSLFAQIPQKSEKGVDKTKKKQEMKKAKTGKMDGKQYKDDSHIEVKDPTLFGKSQENQIFSGPQPGEKLPSLQVAGISGEIDGKTLDITANADGNPLVLFLQDTNGVGIKGLVSTSELLLQINAFKKRHSKAISAKKSNQGLQIGVVLLADNLDTLPEWAHNMLKKEIPNEVLKGISPDGREGPGSYGLNRNVAQTILIAKDGKVLHNFALTQPMLYTDPHLLGAIAQALEIKPTTLEQWLNDASAKRSETEDSEEKSTAAQFAKLYEALTNGKISREEAAAWLKKLGITWEEGEALLKKTKSNDQTMDRKQQYENRRQVEVADPTGFNTSEENEIFSGPQPGEKLPPLNATSIVGESEGKTFDFTKTDGQPLVLFLQDEDGAGLRGLYDISRMIAKIANESNQELHTSVVFLGDNPDALKQRVSGVASGIAQSVSKNVLFGISPDGREGPGNYGLNRNVAQTIIIAKDGKVLHNFAFTQPTVYADPHVLGAIAHAIGEEPASVEKWLNEASADDQRRQRADTSAEAQALGKRLREMVEKGEITGEEARERYEKAFPRSREHRRSAED